MVKEHQMDVEHILLEEHQDVMIAKHLTIIQMQRLTTVHVNMLDV